MTTRTLRRRRMPTSDAQHRPSPGTSTPGKKEEPTDAPEEGAGNNEEGAGNTDERELPEEMRSPLDPATEKRPPTNSTPDQSHDPAKLRYQEPHPKDHILDADR